MTSNCDPECNMGEHSSAVLKFLYCLAPGVCMLILWSWNITPYHKPTMQGIDNSGMSDHVHLATNICIGKCKTVYTLLGKMYLYPIYQGNRCIGLQLEEVSQDGDETTMLACQNECCPSCCTRCQYWDGWFLMIYSPAVERTTQLLYSVADVIPMTLTSL